MKANPTKLTRQQREALRAQTRQEEKANELKRKEELILRNPLRMLQLMSRAMMRGYCHNICARGTHLNQDPFAPLVNSGEDGVLRVEFTFSYDVNGKELEYDNTTVLYVTSEDWEFEALETHFNDIDLAREASMARVKLARETFDRLTPEEREALGLKYRP